MGNEFTRTKVRENVWGSVCSDKFTNTDASVFCASIGLEPKGAVWTRSETYKKGDEEELWGP